MTISFDRVSFSYDNAAQPALADLTLDVPQGSLVCVVGRTGSGKSTLVELACGAKVPSSGHVLVDGADSATKHGRAQVRQLVGYVMQRPERQLFAETVADDVAFGPRNLGWDEDRVSESVASSLALLGLDVERVGGLSPFDLSGGQRRRVAIAGVIAMQPPAIALDEPMAGLDPSARDDLRRVLAELHQRGTTLLMVSHDMDDVAALADRVVVLDRGHAVLEGPVREVFAPAKAAQLARCGVGLPTATRVATDLAARGIVLPGPTPLTLEELAQAIVAAGETGRPTASSRASVAPSDRGGEDL